MHNHSWEEAQEEELAFWNSPGAEFGEQMKQLTYAKFLELMFMHDGNSPYVIDKTGKEVLDIGGGPVSLLLKTRADRRTVADPCSFPSWVKDRYLDNGVEYWRLAGEDVTGQDESFDEVWMYNVLQHTQNPQKIFENIYATLKEGGTFRFLDWLDTPTNTAHPISLNSKSLTEYITKAKFNVFDLYQQPINENGAVGTIAYGIFKK